MHQEPSFEILTDFFALQHKWQSFMEEVQLLNEGFLSLKLSIRNKWE